MTSPLYLVSKLSTLPDTIEACHVLIGELMARLAEVEEQLGLNSLSSSKPPSSDGPGQRSDRYKKPSTGRKRGGQPGHKGHFRAAVPEQELDHIIECPPPAHCVCGGTMIAHGDPYRHQVFELPPIKPIVTEYRCQGGCCTVCGQYQRAPLPPGVPQGQLGPRALAIVGTLASHYHLPQFKLKTLLTDLFGLRFSVGCISAAHGIVAEALKPICDEVHEALRRAPVKHMDETTHQCHSFRLWTWALVAPWGASFTIHPSRGQCAAKEVLGETPNGILVTDRYAGYRWVDQAQRQVCWSHVLRDFHRIGSRPGLPGVLGRSLERMGHWMFRCQHRNQLTEHLPRLQERIRRVLQRGAEQRICAKTANTCRNLLDMWPSLWRFASDPTIPATNNAAERALRGMVVRRKISYVTRSGRGMRFWERAYGAVHTCVQQGRSTFHFFCSALQGYFKGGPVPSLVPAAPS